MPKSALRKSKASGSTKRLVERIVRLGTRVVRRKFIASDRVFLEGGRYGR